jgi:hypothetical protein
MSRPAVEAPAYAPHAVREDHAQSAFNSDAIEVYNVPFEQATPPNRNGSILGACVRRRIGKWTRDCVDRSCDCDSRDGCDRQCGSRRDVAVVAVAFAVRDNERDRGRAEQGTSCSVEARRSNAPRGR